MKTARMNESQLTAWFVYEAAMVAARDAALALADTLEAYIRHDSTRMFHAACDAATNYWSKVKAAQPYHFGAIPMFRDGHVVNSDADQLLAFVRELRGSERPIVRREGDRVYSTMAFADNGIAGFFLTEVAAMRQFGSPRRSLVDGLASEARHAA
jgi:hypothetical protein